MAALLTDRDAFTLEEMAAQYGGFELQRPLTKAEFVALAERHPDLAMEREPDGTTTLMSPVKRGSAKRESTLNGYLFMWNHQHGLGELHSASSGFNLPNGAIKSPDAAWISYEKINAEQDDDEERFTTLVPDFVAEVRSATDRLKKLQKKMTDTWMANGVRLAWLIDPYEEKAYMYRQGQSEPDVVEGFAGNKLFGEEVLPGFELSLETMQRKG